VTDFATDSQRAQMEQILSASCFTDRDRDYWRLQMIAAERFEVRQLLYNLAVEYRRRAPREDQEAA